MPDPTCLTRNDWPEMTDTGPDDLQGPLEIAVMDHRIDTEVRVPGSKSITNRALVCAALAEGTTRLSGVLFADDTEAMLGCLRELGARLTVDRVRDEVVVQGMDGEPRASGGLLDARMSGTTSRFVMPMLALGRGTYVLDGAEQLRARPMGDLIGALEHLGVEVEPLGEPGRLPVRVDADGLRGGPVTVRGDASSQFLSGLLLSAPCTRRGLDIDIDGELVSVPYVSMTLAVMASFGAAHDGEITNRVSVPAGGYISPEEYHIEPDASAASYFFAAAALTGGRVRVEGLGRTSLQGDVRFAQVLGEMGAEVHMTDRATEVRGTGELRGVDVDMADISDTAQTLAVLAPFAQGPTTVRGIGFIRGKETDRIAAVVNELRRCGVDATETDDGFRVEPGQPRAAVVRTYDDHRMAMSFAVMGLRTPGLRIEDPGCVAKTFPRFWETFSSL